MDGRGKSEREREKERKEKRGSAWASSWTGSPAVTPAARVVTCLTSSLPKTEAACARIGRYTGIS